MSRRLRQLAILVAIGTAAAAAALLWVTRPFPEPPPAVAESLPDGLYADASANGMLVVPFSLAPEPMARLLLVNLERDPDSVYVGFEPQWFDDSSHGAGLIVLGWRVDGYVDVYHAPSIRVDPAAYAIAGRGLRDAYRRDFSDARFVIADSGVDADIAFVDALDRAVSIRLHERAERRAPFALLAPMGAAATAPTALPLVFLHGFDFVRAATSDVEVRIADRVHALDRLPLPLDGQRRWFTRYAAEPMIVRLNPAGERTLTPIPLESGGVDGDTLRLRDPNGLSEYALLRRDGHAELASITQRLGQRDLRMEFTPAFPRVDALRVGATAHGVWRISGDPALGTVLGEWELRQEAEAITLHLRPSGGWWPRESKRSVRLIYRLARDFRDWPRSYQWLARLERSSADSSWTLTSRWQRN